MKIIIPTSAYPVEADVPDDFTIHDLTKSLESSLLQNIEKSSNAQIFCDGIQISDPGKKIQDIPNVQDALLKIKIPSPTVKSVASSIISSQSTAVERYFLI